MWRLNSQRLELVIRCTRVFVYRAILTQPANVIFAGLFLTTYALSSNSPLTNYQAVMPVYL